MTIQGVLTLDDVQNPLPEVWIVTKDGSMWKSSPEAISAGYTNLPITNYLLSWCVWYGAKPTAEERAAVPWRES